jgi:hypothetical protein
MATERQSYRGKFILALFSLISVACFCRFDPYAHLLTTKEPDAADVTGLYILKEQTLTNEGLDFLQGLMFTYGDPDSGDVMIFEKDP